MSNARYHHSRRLLNLRFKLLIILTILAGLRGSPGIQLGAQTFYLQVAHQVVVAGVIAVAPQRRPSFDVGGIEAIGPRHRNLVMLEHPVEPAPPRRRDVLWYARPAPHLVPQMHEGRIRGA